MTTTELEILYQQNKKLLFDALSKVYFLLNRFTREIPGKLLFSDFTGSWKNSSWSQKVTV